MLDGQRAPSGRGKLLDELLDGAFRRAMAHDRHLKIVAFMESQGAFDGAHDPIGIVAKRSSTQQRQKHPPIAGALRVQDRGANRRFIRSVENEAREIFPEFGRKMGIGDRQGGTIRLGDPMLAILERNLGIPLDADPQEPPQSIQFVLARCGQPTRNLAETTARGQDIAVFHFPEVMAGIVQSHADIRQAIDLMTG